MSSDTPSKSPAPATSELPASVQPPTSPIGKTWKQAEGLPETVAPLEQLPAGVQLDGVGAFKTPHSPGAVGCAGCSQASINSCTPSALWKLYGTIQDLTNR